MKSVDNTSVSNQSILLNRIMFVLSLIGIVTAIYVLQSFLRQAPIVCLNSGCELVRKNPASYIFGVPVPAFGLIGYSVIAILTFLRTSSTDLRLLTGILGVATFGVLFVSWFTYTELFVIHGICTWCALSAVTMTVIFILTVISYKNSNASSKALNSNRKYYQSDKL